MAFAMGAGFWSPKARAGTSLTIGSVSRSLKEEIETFRPLADYLTPRLTAAGIEQVEIAVTTTSGEMTSRIAAGEVDLYIDSPFVVAKMHRQVGLEPLVRRWKKGAAEYHTVFVSRADSGIVSFDDLLGRVIAFDDPQSSSGHLLPKAMLLEQGYRLIELRSAGDFVPPDAIGYVFSMDDVNTLFWVARGRVAAGVTSPDFVELYGKTGNRELAAFARSIDIPRHVVAHRPDLDPAVVREVERVLLDMENHPEGRAALQAFQKTTRFDRFPNGVEATFAPILAMIARLDDIATN
jgi:phosphonate transport system substrate-binding protein